MGNLNLAICDGDELYCKRLNEYLHENLKLSFDIFSFTETGSLRDFAKEKAVALLLASEEVFSEIDICKEKEQFRNIIVLDEGLSTGNMVREDDKEDVKISYVSKFQPAGGIVESITAHCMTALEDFGQLSACSVQGKGKIIGFYTPLSRCGQTTLAMNMAGEIAGATGKKVIFLSFESFSCLPKMLDANWEEDITDLLYMTDLENTGFELYLEKIKKSRDGVDYVMPARTAQQMRDIDFNKINMLISNLVKSAGYDYIFLDLSEHLPCLMEVLLICSSIISVTGNNPSDEFRLQTFDEILMESGYGELKANIIREKLPELTDKRAYGRFVAALSEKVAS